MHIDFRLVCILYACRSYVYLQCKDYARSFTRYTNIKEIKKQIIQLIFIFICVFINSEVKMEHYECIRSASSSLLVLRLTCETIIIIFCHGILLVSIKPTLFSVIPKPFIRFVYRFIIRR